MTNKAYIDTYSTVYGVDIIVANKHVNLEELQELCTYSDDVELNDSITNGLATTSTCKYKKTGRYCILVKYNNDDNTLKGIDKKNDFINTCAHEAYHVLALLMDFIHDNSRISSDLEATAFLVGWITQKIYETWTRK